MKKILQFLMVSGFIFSLFGGLTVKVQAAITNANISDQSAQIAEEGKIILNQVKTNGVKCGNLSDADFEAMGYYFMNRMMGDSYITVHNMMNQTLGDDGQRGTYVIIGKRMSDCYPSEQFSNGGYGFGPMMSRLSNFQTNYSSSCGGWMDRFGYGYGWGQSWIWALIIWIAVIFIMMFLVKKIMMMSQKREMFRILEERYARGEIDIEEFEERKRALMERWHHWRRM